MSLERTSVAFSVWIFLQAGCSTGARNIDLGVLYNRAAQYHGEKRNPVIVIPGILGSKLTDSDSRRAVWGAFSGNYADPGTPEGARLVALPMGEGVPLGDLRDGIVADGVLDRIRVNFLVLPLELRAYVHILRALGVGGYRDEDLGLSGEIDYGEGHFTCFQFPYDWRRDNVENAIRLHEFIARKRDYVRSELRNRFGVDDPDVKFDIVAHSMGGLVARYYLRSGPNDLPPNGSLPPVTWEGSRYVDKVVLIAPPNAGSLEALRVLVEGMASGPLVPFYPAALIGTMPSAYQLLPRTRHSSLVYEDSGERVADVFSPALWAAMGWGLASAGQEPLLEQLLPHADPATRRRIALDHVSKCLERARRFTEALDVPAVAPTGVSLYLVAGDSLPTDRVFAVNRAGGSLRVVERGPGDGQVLRASALMDERSGRPWEPRLVSPVTWKHVLFLSTDHLGLTRTREFTDNVLYHLMEQPHGG